MTSEIEFYGVTWYSFPLIILKKQTNMFLFFTQNAEVAEAKRDSKP